MAEKIDLFGAIDFAGDAAPSEEQWDAEPAVEPDKPPVEHNSIINTPVEVPIPDTKKRASNLQKNLQDMYVMLGIGIAPFDEQTATVILDNSERCASSLDDLAKKNPAVKRALEGLMTTSAYGAVIAAHLPILVTVATKYIPPVRDRYADTLSMFAGATGDQH